MVDAKTVDVRLAVTDALPPGELPVMLKCPKHKDSTNSLAVYASNLHCFGCGFHVARRYEALAFVLGYWDGNGDAFVGAMRARSTAEKYTPADLDAYRARAIIQAKKYPINPAVALGYMANLHNNPGRRDRLAALCDKRGLLKETTKRAHVGYDTTRYTIPVYDRYGKLLTIRFRRDDKYGLVDFYTDRPKPKYEGLAGYNGTYLYPMNLLEEIQTSDVGPMWEGTLFVVEGELDALTLYQMGLPVLTITNGAGQIKNLLPLYQESFPDRPLDTVVIVTDQDEPGQQAALELSIEAEARGMTWERWSWDREQGKDITEFLLNHSIEELSNERCWDIIRPHRAD